MKHEHFMPSRRLPQNLLGGIGGPFSSGSIGALLAAARTACFASLLRLAFSATGGASATKPSNVRSKIGDMCGDFRGNFEEIPTLPEQTAAQRRSLCAVPRGKISNKWLCHLFEMPSRHWALLLGVYSFDQVVAALLQPFADSLVKAGFINLAHDKLYAGIRDDGGDGGIQV